MLEELKLLFPRDDAKDEEEQLPRLHRVVLALTESTLDRELSLGGLDVNAVDSRGVTALAWACQRNDLAAIALLLKAGGDPNLCNISASPPIFLVTGAFDPRPIRLMLEAGADVTLSNKWKSTALHCAAVTCHHACHWRLPSSKRNHQDIGCSGTRYRRAELLWQRAI